MEDFDAHIKMPGTHQALVRVEKDEAVLKAVRKKLEAGLSPSALGNWLRCPLDFHFKDVLRLKESEEVDVHIAPNILGNALHKAMEKVYEPLLKRPLQAAPLLEAVGNIEGMIVAKLEEEMAPDQLRQGQPLLQLRMAADAAQRFLRSEAYTVEQGAVITPLELEADLKHSLDKASKMIGSPVLIKGRLDRVDLKDGLVQILDLKSGKVNPGDLALKEMTVEGLMGDKRYAAQLLVYAWLYLQEHPEVDAVQAGILPLQRAASSEPLLLKLPGGETITRADLPEIETLLTEVVQRMMDPGVLIEHDPKSKNCTFCLVQD